MFEVKIWVVLRLQIRSSSIGIGSFSSSIGKGMNWRCLCRTLWPEWSPLLKKPRPFNSSTHLQIASKSLRVRSSSWSSYSLVTIIKWLSTRLNLLNNKEWVGDKDWIKSGFDFGFSKGSDVVDVGFLFKDFEILNTNYFY